MDVPFTRRGFGGVGVSLSALFLHVVILSPQASADVITCDGDANADGIIDFGDVNSVLGNWLNNYLPGSGPGDANGDGVVDFGDLNSALGNWLGFCVSTLRVAEPGTWHTPPAAPEAEHDLYSAFDYCATSVYAATGEFHHEAVDLAIPGRGIHFTHARKYRSRAFQRLNQPGAITSVMGNNWTHSYAIRVEDDGAGNLFLNDGNSRRDLYEFDPNTNTWIKAEFFREITLEPDLSFVVRFAHTGTWLLNPLDGSPTAGKINAIVDRNGNTMTFAYDPAGQLVSVIDPLDSPASPRQVTFAYNPDGLLETVTDWVGRTVFYQYYNDGDAGGSFGDLKSVTTPAVVATPDFPIPPEHEYLAGKTTVYTYSTGFADDRLNHNLLTITDPKGQTYLTNTYALPIDPSELDFDRVSRQVYGDPTDTIDFFYKRIIGDVDASVVLRAFVRDRNGNVEEWTYDDRNRPVRVEELTGRTDPLLPPGPNNQPIRALQVRDTDPPSFVKTITWNPDSLPNDQTYPELNIWQDRWTSDLGVFDRRSGGNRLEIHRLPGPLGGDQLQIDEFLIYDPTTNFVTQHTDARGNITTFVRDPNGNVTQKIGRIPTIIDDFTYNPFGQMTLHVWPDNGSGHRREDEFIYFDILSPQYGYLFERIVDSTSEALTTRSTYDRVGNEIVFEDAKGKQQLCIYNQLYQCVQARSRPVDVPIVPFQVRYGIDIFYDANDMPARIDIDNIDENGVTDPINPHITTIHDYDILNYRVATSQEKNGVFVPRSPPALDSSTLNPADFIKVEIEYDANRNNTLVRSGEATNGNQPNNVVRTEYDERDLVFKIIEGAGGPDQSSTQLDYDGNGNTTAIRQGLEALGQGGTPRLETRVYDGFDRWRVILAAMGNETRLDYDANSNVVRQQVFGAAGPDVPGNASDVRLNERNTTFDPLDRPILVIDEFFDPVTFLPLDDGTSLRTINWTDCSMLSLVTDDNAHSDAVTYDTVIRASEMVDAVGNRMIVGYDRNSNVTSVTSEEVNGALPPNSPPDIFVQSTSTYDAVDRLTSTQDGSGNIYRIDYDSRGNAVRTLDPNNIETRFIFDPLSRPIQMVRDMNGNGADALDPLDIVLEQIFDDSHRLTSRIDDNDNELKQLYDDLSREIESRLEDDTFETSSFDVHHNLTSFTDANDSTATNTYDLENRLVRTDIVVGPGVSAETTFEEFDWDGLSRLLRAEDDDSVVQRTWDSLDNMTSETLNGRTFQYTHDGVGNQLSVLYPGGTFLTRTYDELNRVSQIFDSGFLGVTYLYAGFTRLARRTLFNNTQTDYAYNGINGVANAPGDLGFKQLRTTDHQNTLTLSEIDVREYKWDGAQNKTDSVELRNGNPHLALNVTYDDAYRGATSTVQDALNMVVRETQYQLDGVGNRELVTENLVPLPYFMDPTFPFPADLQVNQYTQAPDDILREHDENGNLTSRTLPDFSIRSLTFNYFDCLVAYADPSSGTSATYRFDALGRRIAKVVTTPMGTEETQFTYALEEQCNGKDDDCDGIVEEWDDLGVIHTGYIRSHGRPLFMNRDGQIRAYHYDDLGNTTVLTDLNGNIQERYEYADFGAPSIFDPAGNPRPETTPENPYLFHTHFYDPETGYSLARNRFLDHILGRFITRDPGGTWSDPGALGNGHTYAGNNPWTYVDPNGRAMAHSGVVNDRNNAKPRPSPFFTPYRPSFTPSGTSGSSRGGCKTRFSDLSMPKTSDAGTAKIHIYCCNGSYSPKITLTIREVGQHAIPYMEYNFSMGMTSGYSSTNGPGGGASGGNSWQSYASMRDSSGPGTTYRPSRITASPTIRGPQTAIVVGKSGEEIYTDKYGRVKVQFHWDRYGTYDENSSCWIGVSQAWAGSAWGGLFIPEIEDEVLVPFMQGNPDRPIITGRLYHQAMPIYRPNFIPQITTPLPPITYTMFSPNGTPLRAMPSVSFKEYKPSSEQFAKDGKKRH